MKPQTGKVVFKNDAARQAFIDHNEDNAGLIDQFYEGYGYFLISNVFNNKTGCKGCNNWIIIMESEWKYFKPLCETLEEKKAHMQQLLSDIKKQQKQFKQSIKELEKAMEGLDDDI